MEYLVDLYTDYLLSSFGPATATGLSRVLDNAVSHDAFTRMLSDTGFDSKYLWLSCKRLVRAHESPDACLVFDDTLIEKPFSEENGLVCWHWDHANGRHTKAINVVTAFYHSQKPGEDLPLRVPVAFATVRKDEWRTDPKTGKQKRASPVTKNQLMQGMITQAIANRLAFKYILADSWFASAQNMRFIQRLGKHFIFDMHTNRLAAASDKDRNNGAWTRIDALEIPANVPVKVWLKDLEFPVLLTRQVLTNQDSTTCTRYLVSNDLELSDDDFTAHYKKRWGVEEYHKSLKQNASAAKSPAHTVTTQANHLFASVLAYIKLERLKFAHRLNHFALKSRIYIQAAKAAFQELAKLKNACPA